MIDVVIQAGALILLGVLWRVWSPSGLEGDTLRHSLTTLVYVLLLPALALVVLWKAPLGTEALTVAGLAFAGLAVGFGSAWAWYRFRSVSRPQMGALLLAATFPNATYMGLPVLEVTLGPWARSIAIQYDLFACTPVLLSAGVLMAARYGDAVEPIHPLRMLMRVPPLWGALAGVLLNLGGVPLPDLLDGLLELLGSAVVPLMLFSIGLGLRWMGSGTRMLGQLWPVLVIQLLLTPAVIWWATGMLAMGEGLRAGIVLEAAMPSMVLGIVLCDRYRLDVALYAMAVTLSTALSLITLPFWFGMTGA
ncbi:AEC family transporter [Thiohalomonas denitrificans]|uniref:Uncharacterized protein n=1 Tax=Thiohalomonas denitrificans TaxID=415747 RepID=A0A1G5PSA4_9GAMM|nr:AEC family transporter [Thiohalomonas denitrificans]SCZ52070.1 hypothetical protein SAMN03097708_00661 [Thiohalomonas denitrificans]